MTHDIAKEIEKDCWGEETPAVGLSELHDLLSAPSARHPKCRGTYDEWSGDYGCEYDTTTTCDECKYGVGRKDPEAECNQLSR
jgi:hypothetical protein